MTLTELRARLQALAEERAQINETAEQRFTNPDDTTEVRGAYLLNEQGEQLRTDDGQLVADPNAGLTDDEVSRFAELEAEETTLRSRIARAEEITRATPAPNININIRNSDPHELPAINTDPAEVRSQAVTAIEGLDAPDHVRSALTNQVEDRSRSDRQNGAMARHIIATSSSAFRSALQSWLLDRPFSDEERAAVRQAEESRATLSLASGFILPATADPTLITPHGVSNPLRQLAEVQSIVTDRAIVHSMGSVEASWDFELEEVSEDTPTIAGTEIDVVKPQVFVPYSIEAEQDIRNLERELLMLMAKGKNKLEANGFVNGTGVDPQPSGVFQGLLDLAVAPAATTLDAAGIFATQGAMAEGYDESAVWLAKKATYNAVRQLESTNGTPLWSSGALLAGGNPELLSGNRYVSSSAVPDGVLLFGDFAAGYRIVDRAGMTIEKISHLMGPNGRPMGKRGLYGHWRVGAGVVDPTAFTFAQAA